MAFPVTNVVTADPHQRLGLPAMAVSARQLDVEPTNDEEVSRS
jgi:hypothetical protein